MSVLSNRYDFALARETVKKIDDQVKEKLGTISTTLDTFDWAINLNYFSQPGGGSGLLELFPVTCSCDHPGNYYHHIYICLNREEVKEFERKFSALIEKERIAVEKYKKQVIQELEEARDFNQLCKEKIDSWLSLWKNEIFRYKNKKAIDWTIENALNDLDQIINLTQQISRETKENENSLPVNHSYSSTTNSNPPPASATANTNSSPNNFNSNIHSENNSYPTTSNPASSSTFSHQDSTNYSSSSVSSSSSSNSSTYSDNNCKVSSSQPTLPKEKADNSSPNLDNAKEETTQSTFGSSPSQKNDTPSSIPTTSLAGNKGEKTSIIPNQSKPDHHPSSLKENSPKQVSEENQANIQTERIKVIQGIQNKLEDLSPIDRKTLLNGKHQNWEQEISQLKSIEQIIAYQRALLQEIEKVSQSQLKQNTHVSSASQEKEKGMVPWIVFGGILVMSGLVGYLVWLKKKKVK